MDIDGIAGWERLPVEPPATPWSFPDPLTAGRDDLVAVGGDLEPGTILGAYRRGLFPMNVNRRHLGWWSPVERGIIPLDRLRAVTVPAPQPPPVPPHRRPRLPPGRRGLRRSPPSSRLDHAGHRRGVLPAARAGLGPQRRGVDGGGRPRGRPLRPAHRRAVRRRVDGPLRARRLEGRAGRPGRPAPPARGPRSSTCSGRHPTSAAWAPSPSIAADYLSLLGEALAQPVG